MTTVRFSHTATLLNNGQVLIAGGDAGILSAELYDPTTGIFTATGSMDDGRENQTATLLSNGQVLIAGGNDSTLAELYLPGTLTPTGFVSITVTPSTPTLSVGSTQQFIATGTFSDGSMQNLQSVTWSSSNQAAGTITNDAERSRRGSCVGGGTVHDYSERRLDKRLGRFNSAVKIQAECWAAGAHKKAGRAYGRDFFTRLARCQSLYILEFCKD